MNKAGVYFNQILAGFLEKNMTGYTFQYDKGYLAQNYPAISFSFPQNQSFFESLHLFPFFSGLLAEGFNKEIQCKALKIDEKDDFSRLIQTAHNDTIGAITLKML